ncbi:MAG TPA: flagellar motor switch protein FliG [Deltaproteobacteria bacterium]|nr:MAG: flagellar motor switch protein FliG [Deltaproteobacteria bacterium GWA2_55_82]OGQ64446.1 MAG: flagellar motor switch protein FliG [Deltaproteobacteria bacterium RIFCSPLOWO2_02_FULL_55_12]OIJ72828.1 MAG: flagellar motor switch protein FliG [Deltaproteobacteria bacterium GWC2_55_46]HBG46106.1 flagellar motor switch protein FliG [Deltaproteobacteria bacterium]HCY11604.1 flagellar motor switch protein FliG [Deltaproteobacteria bacterium]
MAKEPRLKGPEKAAILLMNIGEELASDVFKFMTPSEMQLLGGMMVRKESISLQMGRHVVSEFIEMLDKGELFVEGVEFARNVMVRTLGPEKAQYILDQITREMGGGGIESLKWMDPALVANIVKDEHPQIIALILAHLDADRAAMVLLNIQEDRLRGEVMLRVANLKRIPQAAVRDLESLISEQMLSAESNQGSSVEGVKLAAEILNQIDSKAEGDIIDIIEKASPDLAMRVQEKMFVFADLMGVDDRGLQLIIKELSSDVLGLALKGSDESIKEKFLKNMSERASEMLREDMEAKGPVKLSDVERSQQEIIKIARRLEQEGKLARSGRGGDVLV